MTIDICLADAIKVSICCW